MARTGRPKAELVLTEEEHQQLIRWSRRATSAQALALRSKIVLACADGADNASVARELRCSPVTVGKWRARFVADRLDGLSDDPRPGRPPVITAEQVEDVVVATLESTPGNATHWTRSKMAERSGLSKSTIGRIWAAFDLKPHRADGFKLSNDPLFVEKVYDVVGLYINPRAPRGADASSGGERPCATRRSAACAGVIPAPSSCRSETVEAGGSRDWGVGRFWWRAAPTTPGRAGTTGRRGSGKQDGKVDERNQRCKAS